MFNEDAGLTGNLYSLGGGLPFFCELYNLQRLRQRSMIVLIKQVNAQPGFGYLCSGIREWAVCYSTVKLQMASTPMTHLPWPNRTRF